MGSDYTLIIGNKNYSSWSMRPWVWMRHHQLNFREHRIALCTDDTSEQIARYGCGSTVPILLDGEIRIWDSLAILEYLAEKHKECNGWPAGEKARAHARSVSAEMHSGFYNIRSELPMNCRRVIENFTLPDSVHQEIHRINEIFTSCLQRYNGEWLFGQYSIADAMYAPVVMRFNTYQVELDNEAMEYMKRVTQQSAVASWVEEGYYETETIEHAEK